VHPFAHSIHFFFITEIIAILAKELKFALKIDEGKTNVNI